MLTPYNCSRWTIDRKKIHLTIGLGCGFDPDETIKRQLTPFAAKPYIKYENTWYLVKNDLGMRLEDMLTWLKNNNYSEEILLEKLFQLIS